MPNGPKPNLLRVWRAQAPKRFLKAYDTSQAANHNEGVRLR